MASTPEHTLNSTQKKYLDIFDAATVSAAKLSVELGYQAKLRMEQRLDDASSVPGAVMTFSPLEAQALGAFEESALSEEDAIDSSLEASDVENEKNEAKDTRAGRYAMATEADSTSLSPLQQLFRSHFG